MREEIRHAFEAWRSDRKERHLAVFIAGLKSGSPDTRDAAMYALSCAGPSVVPRAVRALKDWRSLWPALRLLGELGGPAARSPVEKLVRSPDHAIRRLAFRTVVKLEGQRPPEETWSREVRVTGRLPSLTTIVHGTWAEDADWWRWPADFPQHLDAITGDFYKGMDAFQWPGDNTPEAREKGARDLIAWLQAHPADRVTLIAHSHGGNVVFKATELAAPGEIFIAKLILLGTPIRDDYAPDLAKIGKIMNIYSEHDDVQSWGTWTPDLEWHIRGDGRMLPDGPQVGNRRVSTQTSDPHWELHTAKLWKAEGLERVLTDG